MPAHYIDCGAATITSRCAAVLKRTDNNYSRTMKIRNILATLLLALCPLATAAQTNCTDAMARYIAASSNTMGLDIIRGALITITDKALADMNIPEGTKAEGIVDRYMETQYKHDQAAIFAKSISDRQDISVEEINALSVIMETPEWQTANAHIAAVNMEGKEVVDVIEKATMDIILGKEPQKIKVKAAPERAQIINRILTTIPMTQMLTSYIDQEIESIEGMADEKVVTKLKDYVHENFATLFCNLSVDSITDDDLKALEMLCDQPAYSKMMDMVHNILKDPAKMRMALVTEYFAWLETQKP